MSDYQQRGTTQEIAKYLFGNISEEELKQLLIRADIPNEQFADLVTYLNLLGLAGSIMGPKIASILLQESISFKRQGRIEGKEIMQSQKMPKTQYMYQSVEPTPTESE